MSETPAVSSDQPGVLGRLVARVDRWLAAEAGPQRDEVDTDHVRGLEYAHVSTDLDSRPNQVRCDLCGALFAIGEMPACLDHVAAHDGQGAGEIDPFDGQGDGRPTFGPVAETHNQHE
jgi:hypothetical protein